MDKKQLQFSLRKNIKYEKVSMCCLKHPLLKFGEIGWLFPLKISTCEIKILLVLYDCDHQKTYSLRTANVKFC